MFFVIYNLLLWVVMRKNIFMMFLIVSGFIQVSNINIYFQLLVKELKEMWYGIIMEDYLWVLLDLFRVFIMRVIILYVIDDYSGLGLLLGIQVRGYLKLEMI